MRALDSRQVRTMLAALALSLAPAVGNGPRADEAAREAAVVLIRAGAISREELASSSDDMKHRRWLLVNGSTVARVRAGYPPEGVEFPPEFYVNRLLPEDVRQHLREQDVAVTIVDPRDVVPDERATDVAADEPPPPHPVIARLRELYGAPEPAGEAETAAVAELRALIGLRTPAVVAAASAASAAEATQPSSIDRALAALAKGARLVVVLEAAKADGESDPKMRDTLLGDLFDALMERKTTSFAELMIPGNDPNGSLLRVYGPGVRRGWVTTRAASLDEVTPTIVWLTGAKPLEDKSGRKEMIDEILE